MLNAESVYINQINDNHYIYAKLDPILILVQFTDEDDNVFNEYYKGFFDEVTFPDWEPYYLGHQFNEWVKIYDENHIMIFEPRFTDMVYTVTFYDSMGEVYDEQTVVHGQNPITPQNPEYDHHIFVGWNHILSNITGEGLDTIKKEFIHITYSHKDEEEIGDGFSTVVDNEAEYRDKL